MPGESLTFAGGYTPQSWEYARAFVGSLGQLPSSFTSTIRLLMLDHAKQPQESTDYGRFLLSRFIRAPAVLAPYYFAIRQFHGDKVLDSEELTIDRMLRLFSGYEHAVILGSISVHRHGKKLCDDEQIRHLNGPLHTGLSMGWFIGNAIPAIGPGQSMVSTGFRILGFIPFIKHDPKGFGTYWHYIRSKRVACDVKYEFDRWQCNSLQTASLLFQSLGFGLDRAVCLMRALTTTAPFLSASELEQSFRVTDIWYDALTKRHASPAIPLPPKFYPKRDALEDLLRRSVEIPSSRETHWLFRGKEDLTPDKAPHLFRNGVLITDVDKEAQVPDEIKEGIPTEDLDRISDRVVNEFLDDTK